MAEFEMSNHRWYAGKVRMWAILLVLSVIATVLAHIQEAHMAWVLSVEEGNAATTAHLPFGIVSTGLAVVSFLFCCSFIVSLAHSLKNGGMSFRRFLFRN
ncbi:MAG: hypothetical protein LBR22_00860 [Desulfovibrio sp.]|jgi:hypothetical protein|nr:hypothetical protein [Desulfovibrio sp.]